MRYFQPRRTVSVNMQNQINAQDTFSHIHGGLENTHGREGSGDCVQNWRDEDCGRRNLHTQLLPQPFDNLPMVKRSFKVDDARKMQHIWPYGAPQGQYRPMLHMFRKVPSS